MRIKNSCLWHWSAASLARRTICNSAVTLPQLVTVCGTCLFEWIGTRSKLDSEGGDDAEGGGAYCRNCCSKCGICCAALALELLLRIVVQNWKYCQWPCVDNYRSESLFKIRSMLQSCWELVLRIAVQNTNMSLSRRELALRIAVQNTEHVAKFIRNIAVRWISHQTHQSFSKCGNGPLRQITCENAYTISKLVHPM